MQRHDEGDRHNGNPRSLTEALTRRKEPLRANRHHVTRPASTRRVNAPTSLGSLGTPATHMIGVPNCMSTRERGSHFRSNVSPIGIIGIRFKHRSARAMRAIRASLVFNGARAGSLWLLPSGKRSTAPSASNTSRTASKASAFLAGSSTTPPSENTASLARRSEPRRRLRSAVV
jgi:hypothetical protein